GSEKQLASEQVRLAAQENLVGRAERTLHALAQRPRQVQSVAAGLLDRGFALADDRPAHGGDQYQRDRREQRAEPRGKGPAPEVARARALPVMLFHERRLEGSSDQVSQRALRQVRMTARRRNAANLCGPLRRASHGEARMDSWRDWA